MEIRQQWISIPFEDQTTIFQDLQQDFQVSNVELSLDLHVPNVSLERICAPPAVHNDCALTEFIEGEERCLKFVNQDFSARVTYPIDFHKCFLHSNIIERTCMYYPSHTHLKRIYLKRK